MIRSPALWPAAAGSRGFRRGRDPARLVRNLLSKARPPVTRFGKLPVFFLLLGIAALSAALFGAVHNQLSYSVGPSYFEALKFAQFGISPETSARLGAALVGMQASWWMGLLVGLPAFLYGLAAVPRTETYFAAGLGAIGLVVVLATSAALVGLVGGIAADATGILDGVLAIPEGPVRSEFLRAGFMHDAAYVAGALGLLLAFWPMRRGRRIDIARANRSGDHDA